MSGGYPKEEFFGFKSFNDECWLIFLNVVLICAGVRECYIYPSNPNVPFDDENVKKTFELIQQIDLPDMIDIVKSENISLYSDEKGEYTKNQGVLLKKKEIDVDYGKMGLQDLDKMDHNYIGQMLGFGEICSGNFNGDYSHQLISSRQGMMRLLYYPPTFSVQQW